MRLLDLMRAPQEAEDHFAQTANDEADNQDLIFSPFSSPFSSPLSSLNSTPTTSRRGSIARAQSPLPSSFVFTFTPPAAKIAVGPIHKQVPTAGSSEGASKKRKRATSHSDESVCPQRSGNHLFDMPPLTKTQLDNRRRRKKRKMYPGSYKIRASQVLKHAVEHCPVQFNVHDLPVTKPC